MGVKKVKMKLKNVISSEIKLTKKRGEEKTQSSSLKEYHRQVNEITKEIEVFALQRSSNLLTVKMALMCVVRNVEKMMHERREQ